MARYPTIESTYLPTFESGRTFHPFPNLPTELRHLIWEAYFDATPHTIFNLYYNARDDGYNDYKIPAPLQINRESRALALKHWKPFNDDPNLEENAIDAVNPEDVEEGYEEEAEGPKPFEGKLKKGGYCWSGKPYSFYFKPEKDILFLLPEGHDMGFKGWGEQGAWSAFPKLSRVVKYLAVPAPLIGALLVGGQMFEIEDMTVEVFRRKWPAVKKLMAIQDFDADKELMSDEEMWDDDDEDSSDERAQLGFGWTGCRPWDPQNEDDAGAWVYAQTGIKWDKLRKLAEERDVDFGFVRAINCFRDAEMGDDLKKIEDMMAWETDSDVESEGVDEVVNVALGEDHFDPREILRRLEAEDAKMRDLNSDEWGDEMDEDDSDDYY